MKHKSMLKKLIFRLALVLGLFFGTAVVCSFAESYTDVNGINYNLNNTTNPPTASVGDNTGFYGSEIIIPPNITISGTRYVVTSVEDNAFKGCTSLIKAPELPATTLTEYCYSFMFYGCSKLQSVTMLATGGFDQYDCLYDWLKDAGTDESVTQRTLKVANETVYNTIVNTKYYNNPAIPDNWKKDASGTTVIYNEQ